jgi:endonuclease/exonuclease/phosphatase family metal-dependent hydrolase
MVHLRRTGQPKGFLQSLGVVIFLVAVLTSVGAKAENGRTIRVATQNMYIGTMYTELLTAQTPQQFVAAVTTIYQQILATKPAERVAAIAREISQLEPDLVGLQQASIVRTGPALPATSVQFDFVALLLAELAHLDKHYSAVAILPGLDAEAPTALGFYARITTRDVIIARTDLDPDDLRISNLQIRPYLAAFTRQTPIGTFVDPSGFASVDARLRGQEFRFVTTHLDVRPAIAFPQALELVESIGATSRPIVLVCDCNATPDIPSDPTFPAVKLIKDAGFVDAFRTARPNDPGFTFSQAENLLNPASSLSRRIDLAQFRGPFGISNVRVFGAAQSDRTPSGLWPSDHAGVAATLSLDTDAKP